MPQPPPRYGPALLVVEDDALVRLSLVDVLTDDGFDVLDAEDAIQALDLICTRPEIAALLTDINLPGGADGFALAKAVRVMRPGLPVLYASGHFSRIECGQAVAGARFLAKPLVASLAALTLRELIQQLVTAPAAPPAGGGERAPY
jgi:CheY-like chemotaxis protein